MSHSFILKDRLIPRIRELIHECAHIVGVEITSLILYGSKAMGDRSSQNEYELVLLVDNDTSITNFIRFQNTIRIELLKQNLNKVKILVYTVEAFEEILFNDVLVGTFLYMICRDHIIMLDNNNEFVKILNRLINSKDKKEDEFLKQCIDFSRQLGSEKWERKWEKALMHYNIQKRKKEEFY